MFKILSIIFVILGLTATSYLFAQEQITITTYYPSPFGSYRELRTNRFVVHPTRVMPTTDGEIFWGAFANRGMLRTDQGSSIELGGTGTPYIDFSNDNSAANNFDARIRLEPVSGVERLRVYTNRFELRQQSNPAQWADVYVKDIYLCHQ